MRLALLGDVVGKAGRDAAVEAIPMLRRRLSLDCLVINGENAAHGFGITQKITAELLEAGADCVTTGNHVWDQREIITAIDGEPRLLRPANYPDGTPGRGAALIATPAGQQVLVINLMGRLFMDALDDPFATIDRLLADVTLPAQADAVLVDFHAEATSEKMAFAHYVDGRVTAVVGTHTHVPTADAQVLPGGTAYLSDLGMCGDYDSVIGMKKQISVPRFASKLPGERMAPAEGQATVCGLFVETDPATGLAVRVAPIRLGGRLQTAMPTV